MDPFLATFVTPLYAAILFLLLTPGVLITISITEGTYLPALVHTVVFFIVFYFTYVNVYNMFVHSPQHKEAFTKKNKPVKHRR